MALGTASGWEVVLGAKTGVGGLGMRIYGLGTLTLDCSFHFIFNSRR